MKKVAVVYSTQYGQTRLIAERICATLKAKGVHAQVFDLKDPQDIRSVPLDLFDGVIIGGPVYAGKFPTLLIEWTKTYANRLKQMPVSFFSVSLNAADPRPKARDEDARLITEFQAETGLKPKHTASLIGALHYREYGFLKRILLRMISKSAGGPTDISRDHELTDWDKVDGFALLTAADFSEDSVAISR